MPRNGPHNVYVVERKTRTRYVVRVAADNAAEACRKADEQFAMLQEHAFSVAVRTKGGAKWSAEELDRRIEAVLDNTGSRAGAIK